MDGLLQHGDVVTHLLDLTATRPFRHVADVLEMEVILDFYQTYFNGLTFSAF